MLNRRTFLSKGAATLVSPIIIAKTDVFSILNSTNIASVNVAVIGTGARGKGLMRILDNTNNVNLIAYCDVLTFRLNEALEIAPKAKAYTDYLELLQHKNLDAIIISTPLNTHAQIASDAVNANLHIYCEKTLVKGAQETKNLVQKVKNEHTKIFQTGGNVCFECGSKLSRTSGSIRFLFRAHDIWKL